MGAANNAASDERAMETSSGDGIAGAHTA